MPVLLGDGLRLLENIDPARVQLELLGVDTEGQRTSFRPGAVGAHRFRSFSGLRRRVRPCVHRVPLARCNVRQ